MRDLIIEMANRNIGSLVLFLKNPKNHLYIEYINKNIPIEVQDLQTSEKIYYFVNDLKSIHLCSCGKHKSFIGFKNGYRQTCGDMKCTVNKRRETCIQKWGVDNPKKSKEVIDREKQNILDKWNGDHYMKNEQVRKKFNSTMVERWGVEWAQQSEEISNKSRETFENNENREQIIENRTSSLINKSKSEKKQIEQKKKKTIEDKFGSYDNFVNFRNDKIRQKSLKNWGVDHHLKSKEIIDKRIESYKFNIVSKIKENLPENIIFIDKRENLNKTDSVLRFMCNNCSNEFEMNRQLFQFRKLSKEEICINCNPILVGKSKKEGEIFEFISQVYTGIVLRNHKGIISKELDIYIPDLKLSFEFNGLYWHSELYRDKNYHQEKSKECINNGIELVHIWEDEWDFKSEIIKSMILNKLGSSKKIWARSCEVKEIEDNKLITEFLNKNHIQGSVGSKYKIGLFYNDELVSLMTFGNLRRSLGHKSKTDHYELIRFCNKLGVSVIGGASKLLSYFIKKYNPVELLSYSDNSKGLGGLYEKLGFELVGETEPNYYWVVDGFRKHRFNFRKDKLVKNNFDKNKSEVQIMTEMGYYRIFDCASKKWSKKII